MVKQLLLCKRLFGEGTVFAVRSDAVSSGLAISLFQDSVEMYIWALIKDRGITVKEDAPFKGNLATVQQAGIALSHIAKLYDLNKARVGFKHNGNLPAPEEAGRFQTYVEDFLRTSFREHFNHDFDELSLVDLVSDAEVRDKLKESETLIRAGEFSKATRELAIAKSLLFSRLNRFVPEVNRNLRDLDNIRQSQVITGLPREFPSGFPVFRYLSDYLERLRQTTLASLLHLPLQDYAFVQQVLPAAFMLGNGEWQTGQIDLRSCDEITSKRAVACLVNLATRLESVS